MGGDLILYQRDLAIAAATSKKHREPTWYMKVKIGNKLINKSTKLRKYEDAYAFARDEYLRLSNAIRLNHSLEDYTFEKHWNDWFQRNVSKKTWKEKREKWHKGYFDRYFKKYFSHADGRSMLLNEITAQVAHRYWDWRISYWNTEQGERIQKYNAKRRGAKTQTTHNVAKVASAKTLAMEQSALNQIFHDAREQGRLQQEFKLKSPKSSRPKARRPHFDIKNEYNRLITYLRFYRDLEGPFKNDKVNEWHKMQRTQLYHFILFMANSGLRVGEAREMRWEDIRFNQLDSNSEDIICEVSVRRATKTGQNRDVQTQASANKTLLEWREKTRFKAETDYVWLGNASEKDEHSKPFTDLNKSFQAFLKRVPVEGRADGLLYNKECEKRSLYSLRHTYATFRADAGVERGILAKNMGTKQNQIEDHYDHREPRQNRSEIVKRKIKNQLKNEIDPAQLDPFLVLANQRYLSGEIDEATFLGIMNSKKAAIISRS